MMDSYMMSFSNVASSEFSYWQQALNQNMNLLFENPQATLPNTEPSVINPSLPSIFNNLPGRTLRQGNITPLTTLNDWQSFGGAAPQNYNNHLTINPYMNKQANRLSISQMNERITQRRSIRQN